MNKIEYNKVDKDNNGFMEKLYKMKPLEKLSQNNNTMWIRVMGGWIFGDLQGTVFIPFDNEFMKTSEEEQNVCKR